MTLNGRVFFLRFGRYLSGINAPHYLIIVPNDGIELIVISSLRWTKHLIFLKESYFC